MLNKYCKGASPQMRQVGKLLFIIGILSVLVGVAIAAAAAYPAVATTLLVNQFINATFLTTGLATAAAGVAATACGGGMMLFVRPGPAGRALQQVQTEVNHQLKLCDQMMSTFERV